MAKVMTLYQRLPPANLTATPVAGGNLVAGTTYYYRVVSMKRINNMNVLSLPTAEVSFTADATNKSVTLAWDAATDVTGYIIQRTTTSGSYPIGAQNSFSIRGLTYYDSYPFVYTGTSLTDTGSTTSGDTCFLAKNFDHSREYNALNISSTTGETITLQDVYLQDVANGWGIIDKIGLTAEEKTITNALITDQCPYLVIGSLYFHACTFQLRGMVINKMGNLVTGSDTILKYGDSGRLYHPYIFQFAPYTLIQISPGGTGWAYLPYNFGALVGTSASAIYDLLRRPIVAYSGMLPYTSTLWDDGIATTGSVNNSIIGLNAGNGFPIGSAITGSNVIWEAHRNSIANLTITDPVLRYSLLGMTWAHNGTLLRPWFQYPTPNDGLWGQNYGWSHIDPVYQSRGQTDNQPYWSLVQDYRGVLQSKLLIKQSFSITVVDRDKNPIQGATIKINDLGGYSDIWEYLNNVKTNLSSTGADSDTITLDSSASAAVNDILRYDNYSEKLLVTAKPTSTTLTITRAQQGTSKQQLYSDVTYKHRLLRQLASLQTDANGQAALSEPLICRELANNKTDGTYGYSGYEDALVTAGNLARTMHTPHTLTISKSGYQTKVMKMTIASKTALTVTLEKQIPQIITSRAKVIQNGDPANNQNIGNWAEV